MAYVMEKRLSKHPERFGKGEIVGVAAPESANNAAAAGAFIPLLSLGIPMNATVALLFAALVIHGVRPGPLLIQNNAEIFWGIIASMYIGNVLLLVLNLPLIGLWVRVLRIPYRIVFPMILLFCLIGAYAVNLSLLDLELMLGFGVLGYVMRKLDYPAAPLILGVVLGGAMERALRQSLMMSQGDLGILVSRPISATMLILTVLLLFLPLFRKANAWRIKAIEENG